MILFVFQGGIILHAQLEIWKAAYSENDLCMQWLPENSSSNASSGGDISDGELSDKLLIAFIRVA